MLVTQSSFIKIKDAVTEKDMVVPLLNISQIIPYEILCQTEYGVTPAQSLENAFRCNAGNQVSVNMCELKAKHQNLKTVVIFLNNGNPYGGAAGVSRLLSSEDAEDILKKIEEKTNA